MSNPGFPSSPIGVQWMLALNDNMMVPEQWQGHDLPPSCRFTHSPRRGLQRRGEVDTEMIQNRRAWKTIVRFKALEGPVAADAENLFVPGVSILGALRHVIERGNPEARPRPDLFGDVGNRALMTLSNFQLLDPQNVARHSLLFATLDRIKRSAGVPHEKVILDNPTFVGTVLLQNGSVYPAVLAYQTIREAVDRIQIGHGGSLGLGAVEDSRMERVQPNDGATLNSVEQVFRRSGHQLIELIAHTPELVYSLEWRDLERAMAMVFEEIGFSVQLTKASQDGGKDIVLYCLSKGPQRQSQKYYVELKHWRRGLRVGSRPVAKLLEVSIRDGASGSVFLSTSGFSGSVAKGSRLETDLSLGDLSTLHTLCRFYLASRQNEIFSTQSLEEIVHIDSLSDDTVKRFPTHTRAPNVAEAAAIVNGE